ncbi:recombinase family protein [Bacillus sp. FJAT-29953]|nr:recombinase family protein [Bacillus sp. FJAT-29953]
MGLAQENNEKVIKHVAMLLRISRDKGENIDTLQNHRERLIRLCNEKGYSYTIYEEIISGNAEMEDREALTKLLEEIHQYDALMVVSTDRIARRLKISAEVFEVLENLQIPIITPDRIYTEKDVMLLKIEAVLAENEYKSIAKRMRENKRDIALRGGYVGSRCPFGYEAVRIDGKRTLQTNEDAEMVQKIFNLAINGYGGKTISDMTGKPYKSVQNIIRNKQYTGTMIYKDIEIPDAFPAIVDMDTFNKANEAMKGRYVGDMEQRTRTKGQVRTILKDLLFCDNCGRKISFQLKSRVYGDDLVTKKCVCGMSGCKESVLLAEFYAQFYWVELYFREKWQKALETPLEDNKQLLEDNLQNEIKKQEKLNKRLKSAKVMRMDGEFTKIEYEEIKEEIEAELTNIDNKVKKLEEQIKSMDTAKLSEGYAEKLKLIGLVKEQLQLPKSQSELNVTTIEEVRNKKDANRLLKLLINKVYYFRGPDVTGVEANGTPIVEDIIRLKIAPK